MSRPDISAAARFGWLLLLFLSIARPSAAQRSQDSFFSNTYNPFKLSICFGDQVQMVQDGSTLVRKMTMAGGDYADLQYYRGHYSNAAGSYYSSVSLFYGRSGYEENRDLDKDPVGFSEFGTRGKIRKIPAAGLSDDDFRKYCGTITAVGMLYQTRGKYLFADEVLSQALKIREARYGKTSRDYINSLHNMAVLRKDQGQYEEAERMLNYLVPTLRKVYGPTSLAYAVVLNNRAMLFAALGRTKEALGQLQEAQAAGQQAFNPEYIDAERVQTNVALLEQELGHLERADSLYRDVLLRMEKKEYEDHPDYNNVLVNYGSLLVQKGDRTVLPKLTELADKIRKRYSENHVLYAKAVTNLGEFYLTGNAFSEALPHFQKVAEIQRTLLGDRHKDYLRTMVKIAVCEWNLNQVSQAANHFKTAIDQYLSLLDQLFPALSESEKAKFWASLRPNLQLYMAFVIDKEQENQYPVMLDLHLRTKGLLLNASNKLKAGILASSDSVLTKTYQDWLDSKNLLATYYSSSLEDIAEDKIDLAKLEETSNALEKKLSSLSKQFAEGYTQTPVSLPAIIGQLMPGQAAVEIIRVAFNYGPRRGDVEYAAFVLKPGGSSPQLVRVKDGNNLEKRGVTFYKNAVKGRLEDDQSFASFWKPIDDLLGPAKTVYASVDGAYNSVNLNTLLLPDKSYLIDKRRIVLIPNTRLLGSMTARQQAPLQRATLVGSPAFGNASVITPLPGTQKEVETIASELESKNIKVEVLLGADASESRLRAVADPSMLHIATHGYFLSDVNSSEGMRMGVQLSRAKDNPLLRSGLLLAGAASAFSSEVSMGGNNNGMLNAYEAMNMDLSETQLVILSACETGTGEIVNGEGVYGLTRAFQVAGARRIIMSLWKVDDAATERLMTLFYQSWMDTNNLEESFHKAQLGVKAELKDPYFWGAFVLIN